MELLRLLFQIATFFVALGGFWWTLVTWEHSNLIRQAELGRKLIDDLRKSKRCENALAMLQAEFYEIDLYGESKYMDGVPKNDGEWLGEVLGAFNRRQFAHAITPTEAFIVRQFEEFHHHLASIQKAIDAKFTTLKSVEIPLGSVFANLLKIDVGVPSFADLYLEFLISTAAPEAILLVEALFPDDKNTAHWFHDYHFHGNESRIQRIQRFLREDPRFDVAQYLESWKLPDRQTADFFVPDN